MMEDIISLVIHEAKKRSGTDLAEEIFLVWMEIAGILIAIEGEIEGVNKMLISEREKTCRRQVILNAHKSI